MGIVFKFILKNIYEKKFRTFLIVFSIMLSSALFFASGALQNTMVRMYADRLTQYYGNSDIMILPNEKSPYRFLSLSGIDELTGKPDYAIGTIAASASYKHDKETANIVLQGINPEDLAVFNPVTILAETELYPFEGNRIIISSYTAGRFGLKAGDHLDLNIMGNMRKFRVCALADASGPFLDENQAIYAIVPRETLAAMFDARGHVTAIYVKAAENQDKAALMEELGGIYERYTVQEPFSTEELARQLSSMTTPFMLMSIIVTLMSIFIIYTSFKVVTMERLPVIGTFRSIGATRKTTGLVLLLESLTYGVIGGGAGCGLGIGILYVMAVFTKPGGSAFKTTIEFQPSQLVTAFIIAIVLSLVSCVIPILKISRIPVKDIVLNVMQKAVKKRPWKLILGISLLMATLIAPSYIPENLSMLLHNVCMLTAVAGVVILIPYLTSALVFVLEKLYAAIFGNIGMIAAKNTRENKSMLNNISLLAIGISSLLMINTISNCVVREVANMYRDAKFDIWVTYAAQADRNLERIIRQAEGVQDVYGVYEDNNIEVMGQNGYHITSLHGIDLSEYSQYWNMNLSEDAGQLVESFNSGRYIILSDALKDRFKVEKGDTVTLRIRGKNRVYEVAGFSNTMYYNGSIAFIHESAFRTATGIRYYGDIYVKASGNPGEVKADIQKRMSNRSNTMLTVKEMEERNKQSNDSMFFLLKGFSIMALVIGVFGILNNLIISFIERRRSLAMLRSVGMSTKQTVSMIFIEALSGGIIGGIAGIAAGFLEVWVIPYVLNALNLSVPISFPFEEVVYYIAAGIAITTIASISPALKSSRLNIIEAIKYE